MSLKCRYIATQVNAILHVEIHIIYIICVESTVTAERLLKALREVKSEDWDKIGEGLYISLSEREKISSTYNNADEQKEALLRTYANEHPHKTWWAVCSALRLNSYQEIADKVKAKYIGKCD